MPKQARGFDTEAAFAHLCKRDRKLGAWLRKLPLIEADPRWQQPFDPVDALAVSYTHLDVYKRQLVQLAQPGRLQGEDRRAGRIIEGQDRIQLVLTHVADGDRHS